MWSTGWLSSRVMLLLKRARPEGGGVGREVAHN
jgi:hypothetical protein